MTADPPKSETLPTPLPHDGGKQRTLLRRAALYPEAYTWYVFFSSLDILFTWIIVAGVSGIELNALANWVIRTYDIAGIVIYKFILVVLVVCICEIVGRRNHRVGLKLARWAIVLSAFPVIVGGVHLLRVALNH